MSPDVWNKLLHSQMKLSLGPSITEFYKPFRSEFVDSFLFSNCGVFRDEMMRAKFTSRTLLGARAGL